MNHATKHPGQTPNPTRRQEERRPYPVRRTTHRGAAMSRSHLLTLTAAAFLVAACGQSQPPGGGMHGMPPAQVVVGTVQPASIPVVFEYVGQTNGSKEVEVRSRVGGILERRMFQEGSRVAA